jgi:hypothetical protein
MDYTSNFNNNIPVFHDNLPVGKIILVMILVIAIICITYQYVEHRMELDNLKHTVNNYTSCPPCPVCPTCPCEQSQSPQRSESKNIIVDINKSESIMHSPLPPPINPLREYDYRALSDPLVPPYKRDDYSIPLPAMTTRGPATAFKKMGLLIDPTAANDEKYKFMLLMGRQKYIGSNYYDYYVTENKPDSALKFDLSNLHKELMTDDTVEIKELNKTYNVRVDRSLGFDYYPFIY